LFDVGIDHEMSIEFSPPAARIESGSGGGLVSNPVTSGYLPFADRSIGRTLNTSRCPSWFESMIAQTFARPPSS
jgi:hypothetical protein